MSKDSAELLGWFGKRKEYVVSDGLRSMFLSVQDCVSELGKAVRSMGDGDSPSAKKAMDRLFICEREADSQEDELCNQISIGELGPQEREDLMHFIRKTDKIANWSKEAAININLVMEVGLDVPKSVWDMIAQSVSDLETEVRNLSNAVSMMGTASGDIMECIRGVRAMERTIDLAYFDITKAVFSSEMDHRAIILMSRVIDAVEMAADTCKACSDTVAILHYAKKV